MWAPAFSPDGKEIVYSRDQPDGLWHLWIYFGRTGDKLAKSLPEELLKFIPASLQRRHGFLQYLGRGAAEHLARSQRGRIAKASNCSHYRSDAYADVSPDGRSIVFTRTEKQNFSSLRCTRGRIRSTSACNGVSWDGSALVSQGRVDQL